MWILPNNTCNNVMLYWLNQVKLGWLQNLLHLTQGMESAYSDFFNAVLAYSQYSTSLHALVFSLWKIRCEHYLIITHVLCYTSLIRSFNAEWAKRGPCVTMFSDVCIIVAEAVIHLLFDQWFLKWPDDIVKLQVRPHSGSCQVLLLYYQNLHTQRVKSENWKVLWSKPFDLRHWSY